jgi:hypothetical protein
LTDRAIKSAPDLVSWAKSGAIVISLGSEASWNEVAKFEPPWHGQQDGISEAAQVVLRCGFRLPHRVGGGRWLAEIQAAEIRLTAERSGHLRDAALAWKGYLKIGAR